MLFTGLLCAKVGDYFSKFRNDRLIFKLVVTSTFISALVESASYISWGYNWGVIGYGNPAVMANVPVVFPVTTLFQAITTLVNQGFYSWRIWCISQNRIIPSVVGLFAVYQLGWIVVYLMPYVIRNPAFAELKSHLFPSGYSWLGLTTLGDLIITASMIYYLMIKPTWNAHQSPKRTQSLLGKIAWRTVQYNALALIDQAVTFSLFLTSTGMWFVIGNSVLCKVYAFALVMSLISRQNNEIAPPINSSDLTHSRKATTRIANDGGLSGIQVNVMSNTIVDEEAAASNPREQAINVHLGARQLKYAEDVELDKIG